VNSDLLFPSGGWQMLPAAAQTIREMAPILAPFQSTTIIVTGYTDVERTPAGSGSRCSRSTRVIRGF
jgi:outer membrane protein OmpA-like peptidoglycan-associated protein